MLIGFLGIPSSGKTTLAATTFVELKRMGICAEFVVEIARGYIAKKRRETKQDVVLTDEDQSRIMLQQAEAEDLMNDKQVIVISDSSPLNSLLYLTESLYEKVIGETNDIVNLVRDYDMLVVCHESDAPIAKDLNRLHGEESRRGLTARLEKLVAFIRHHAPDLLMVERQYHEDMSNAIAFKAVDAFYAVKAS